MAVTDHFHLHQSPSTRDNQDNRGNRGNPSNGDIRVTFHKTRWRDLLPHPPTLLSSPLQIGPNVSIGAPARVGPGVRLSSCIVLDEVEIKVRKTHPITEEEARQRR